MSQARGLSRRLVGVLVVGLPLLAAPVDSNGPTAPERWRVLVPAAVFDGGSSLSARFADRVARGLERRGEMLDVLDPDHVERALRAADAAPEEVALARRATQGDLTPTTAAAARRVLAARTLALGVVGVRGDAAVVELWDLRGPWLLASRAAYAAHGPELLSRADSVAGELLEAWPLEGWLLPYDDRDRGRVQNGRFEVDLGRRHGLRASEGVWLLTDLARDREGRYLHVVATGRLVSLGSRTAKGVVEQVRPGAPLDQATVLLTAGRTD